MKHVWAYWGAISRQLKPALAAQSRLERQRRRSNPGSGWSAGSGLRKWLEWGPVRCFRVRFPGGAVLNCWGGERWVF